MDDFALYHDLSDRQFYHSNTKVVVAVFFFLFLFFFFSLFPFFLTRFSYNHKYKKMLVSFSDKG